MKPEIIILGNSRQVGKDTFYNLLNKLYPVQFQRAAFADELKNDLDIVSRTMFNKGIWDLNGKEKEIMRPILVSYGCAWREIDPLHWVKKISQQVYMMKGLTPKIVPVCCDGRFCNEVEYFKNIYGDKCIFVEINRIGAPEPTEEEKRNIPLLKKYVDYSLTWPTAESNLQELEPYVIQFYEKYFAS